VGSSGLREVKVVTDVLYPETEGGVTFERYTPVGPV